jgi:hypothetical protein
MKSHIQTGRTTLRNALIALSVTLLSAAHATEGHNGIRFDMQKADVEKMGFVCRESTHEWARGEWRCKHMDMTGRAFSKNLERYELAFDKEGAMASISAYVIDPPRSLNGLIAIAQEIQGFYPSKSTQDLSPELFRYFRPDGSAAQVNYLQEARAVLITFFPKGSITS